MKYYFTKDGTPILKRIGFVTTLTAVFYLKSFIFDLKFIKDNTMNPILQHQSLLNSDIVLFKKYVRANDKLQNKIVAIQNPYNHKQVLFRRVVAVQSQWIERLDDGGLLKVPQNFIWVECDNKKEQKDCSLSNFGGPISQTLVLGEVRRVVWPYERSGKIGDLQKYVVNLGREKIRTSKVYSSQEIYDKFGLIN